MNESRRPAVYENEHRMGGKRVPLMNPLSISCAGARRKRWERLEGDGEMRKGLLKSRLLRQKSNEIRMNGVSWIAGLCSPFERKSTIAGAQNTSHFSAGGRFSESGARG